MVKPEFDELVERHSAEIVVYAWRKQRDRSDPQDCSQGRSYVHFKPSMIQFDLHFGETVLHGI